MSARPCFLRRLWELQTFYFQIFKVIGSSGAKGKRSQVFPGPGQTGVGDGLLAGNDFAVRPAVEPRMQTGNVTERSWPWGRKLSP
jgi:hypothetical protein